MFKTLIASATVLWLSACASTSAPMFSQAHLPESVKVPPGHQVSMETVGVGRITYECREKQGMSGQYEWAFVGPDALLNNRKGQAVGKYYGPPATWESADGSKVSGTQVAVAPAGPGSIPLQLVKVGPANGSGVMTVVSHIQRVATQGGVAPQSSCNNDAKGRKEIVNYQADYIFWKAN